MQKLIEDVKFTDGIETVSHYVKRLLPEPGCRCGAHQDGNCDMLDRRHLIGIFATSVLPAGSFLPLAAKAQTPATINAAINVMRFGAKGNGVTDDATAIQAAIAACDPNRGGTVYFPRGKYRIATGLTVTYQGTELVGEGMPGVSYEQGMGSSRIISDPGITAITAYSGSHGTTGYAFRRLHVQAAVGATIGNGILIKDTENFIVEDVTCSDFIGGVGLDIDGGSGNGQYGTLRNYGGGDCLNGLRLKGYAPNGLRVFGGYFAGAGTTPRVGSIGINVTTGDTFKAFGTVVQGYETGYYFNSPAAGAELHSPRAEFCNICYRLGAKVNHFRMYGGVASNSILVNTGAGNIGIQIDYGATAITLDPTIIDGTTTPILDKSDGQVQYPTYGARAPF